MQMARIAAIHLQVNSTGIIMLTLPKFAKSFIAMGFLRLDTPSRIQSTDAFYKLQKMAKYVMKMELGDLIYEYGYWIDELKKLGTPAIHQVGDKPFQQAMRAYFNHCVHYVATIIQSVFRRILKTSNFT